MVKRQPDSGSKVEASQKRKCLLASRRWQLIIGGGILVVAIIIAIIACAYNQSANGLKAINSQTELNKVYDDRYGASSNDLTAKTLISGLLSLPYNILSNSFTMRSYNYPSCPKDAMCFDDVLTGTAADTAGSPSSNTDNAFKSSSSDYSTTNIQMENVDEADIIKTDGEYIYSLSDNHVVITDTRDASNLTIASEISVVDGYPIDLMLTDNNKLVVIAENLVARGSIYASSNKNDTIVTIYDITDRTTPEVVKNFRLYEPYYTSRRIDNKLYVISSGNLRQTKNDVDHYYREDGKEKDLGLDRIYRLDGVKTTNQTLLAEVDLVNLGEINLNSYLVDINNAYISENNIYLANEVYSSADKSDNDLNWWSIFGWKGVWGLINTSNSRYSYSNTVMNTEIYKFNITDDGLRYVAQAKTEGEVINQFSFDEYESNLRVATKSNDGSRVVIFDNNLNKIGASEYLAKGEEMYASRFMGPRAYLVTYLVTDPLYVIDVSNPRSPQTLGELKIPGYSIYLHPYDETHLIGIGMDSTETTRKDSNGRVISTSSRITGMKMALFDVTNVLSPKQISEVKIGDTRTTSAILTNHKALLFSKEKELLAIPVNNYQEDFDITSSDNIETLTGSYTGYSKPYISEGYFVYNINLADGITEKGVLTHNPTSGNYVYSSNTRLLRGLYIDNNLFTISEDMIQANSLFDLAPINQLNLVKE